MKRSIIAFTAILGLFLNTATATVVEKPWLRDFLPEKISAYVRIPNPKFAFAKSQTPAKSTATAQVQYTQFIQAATDKLFKQFSQLDMPPQGKASLELLLTQIVAPLEVFVTDFSDGKTPPILMVATQLKKTDSNSVTSLLKQLSQGSPLIINSMSDTQGTLLLGPIGAPGIYGYNPKNGRLLLVIGTSDIAKLDLLNTSTPTLKNPIRAAEQQIDAHGMGFFAWVKPNPVLWMQAPLDDQVRQVLELLKITELREVAMGAGLGSKRPKIKLLLDIPAAGLRQLIPAHNINVSPAYHGSLASVFSLSLPNEKQLDSIAAFIAQAGKKPNKILADYQTLKKRIATESGIQFSTLMKLIGHQLIVFTDDNGQFLALPAAAEPALEKFLTQLSDNNLTLIRDTTTIKGSTIHHLSLQKAIEQLAERGQKNLDATQKSLLPLLSQLYLPSNHIYWVKSGDSLLFNALPQPLMAHVSNPPSGKISQWLTEQHLTLDGSFFSGLMTFRNLSQKSYYGHLKLLQLLADASHTPLDIDSFPTANTLNLPRYGALALQIHNGGKALSLEYSSENGFSDIWQAMGSTYAFTMVGMIAAVAIPAYQDYTVRAQLNHMLIVTTPMKLAISEMVANGTPLSDINVTLGEKKTGAMSDLHAEAEQAAKIDSIKKIAIKNGKIIITLGRLGKTKLSMRTLTLVPSMQNATIKDWQCTRDSRLPARLVPAACRNLTLE